MKGAKYGYVRSLCHCNLMTVMATEDIKNADDCVSIHTVERALGDYAMQHKDVYYKAPEKETGV
ncbi:MAG: hypothetical protein U0M31_02600, partial [Oscillospiraceae bacterium]|nr:hypothetical protein [Oscillospiraceae bacterium]